MSRERKQEGQNVKNKRMEVYIMRKDENEKHNIT
jgi:hypothetical protein